MTNAPAMDSDPELLIKQIAGGWHVILNRPEALNALNSSIVKGLHHTVDLLGQENERAHLVLSGSGSRAFSAGADIKAIYYQGIEWRDGAKDRDPMQNFFIPEYALDIALYHLDKPKTVVMNGIVMGGGYGLAAACDVRIATENTIFAMPETGIGFFADVGAVYHLWQAPGLLGAYCAVSGEKVSYAGDLLALGVATHYVPAQQCPALVEELSGLESPDRQAIQTIADRYHTPPDDGAPLVLQQAIVDDCFGVDTVQDVVARFDNYSDDFARHTHDVLETRAPLSLAVTFEHFRRAKDEDFNSVMKQEQHIAAQFMREPCFYEGVRAMLIDKDKTPKWEPESLKEIDNTMLYRSFFSEARGF